MVEKISDVNLRFPKDKFSHEFMDFKRETGLELQRRKII